MSTSGKLVQQYPKCAIELPNSVTSDTGFITEISNILTQMDTEAFEAAQPTTVKAGKEVEEDRDSVDPSYFIQLFFGILRGMGRVVDPPRVIKRIADEVLWKDAAKPWRRSAIWLVLRVAIQTSLGSKVSYKHFMAFFHVEILSRCLNSKSFSSDLLFAMRVKMARRLYKLKASVPDYIVDSATAVANAVQKVLQKQWSHVQDEQRRSPEWDPSTFDLAVATHQTLPNSYGYLGGVFWRRSNNVSLDSFTPKHEPRLENVEDFAQYADGNLEKAFLNDKHVALFDFESSVLRHLASWTRLNSDAVKATNACKIILSCFR